MDRSDVSSKLKTFLETECEVTIPAADAELDIDSFNMMLIITYIDEDLSVKLDMDSLDFDAFTSLNTLTDLVVNHAQP